MSLWSPAVHPFSSLPKMLGVEGRRGVGAGLTRTLAPRPLGLEADKGWWKAYMREEGRAYWTETSFIYFKVFVTRVAHKVTKLKSFPFLNVLSLYVMSCSCDFIALYHLSSQTVVKSSILSHVSSTLHQEDVPFIWFVRLSICWYHDIWGIPRRLRLLGAAEQVVYSDRTFPSLPVSFSIIMSETSTRV